MTLFGRDEDTLARAESLVRGLVAATIEGSKTGDYTAVDGLLAQFLDLDEVETARLAVGMTTSLLQLHLRTLAAAAKALNVTIDELSKAAIGP